MIISVANIMDKLYLYDYLMIFFIKYSLVYKQNNLKMNHKKQIDLNLKFESTNSNS